MLLVDVNCLPKSLLPYEAAELFPCNLLKDLEDFFEVKLCNEFLEDFCVACC